MSSSSSTAPNGLRVDAGVIGLVGLGHLISHFSQLLLAPLFPWLKDAFSVSYAQLGFLMTLFFVVSCAMQAASGFLVDRYGPRNILFAGLALISLAAFGMAASTSYEMLAVCAVIAGAGNAVFHPVDFTLLNRKVSASRLGHAYSVHGLTGSLGWALAPALLVPLTLAYSWRVALVAAGALVVAVMAVLWICRDQLALPQRPRTQADPAAPAAQDGSFDFLRIPSVWMCFFFFLLYAVVLSVVQAFAPEAARQLHGVPVALAAACVTVYMVASAAGIALGGFLVADPQRCERIMAAGMGVAALIALAIGFADLPAMAVPALFGAMGFAAGLAGPSRDLIVKRSTPEHATGRVYGVVYAGLDIGQALAAPLFGGLLDRQQYQGVWLGLVIFQGLLIFSAVNVRKVRRTARVPAGT
ncbi:MAG: MFS transporter [Ramlibacter sp.]|jgi:MFS family permease